MEPVRFSTAAQVRKSQYGIPEEKEEQESGGQGRSQDSFQEGNSPEEELSVEEEMGEGQRHEEELMEKYGPWESPWADEILDECLEFLLPLSRRPEVEYAFETVDTPLAFASSCSNGFVVFSRGLLEHLDEEEILFFAAHEMAHTELRHFASRQRRLGKLRRSIPMAPGTPARQRLETAAVLAVRHLEEFEADHMAAEQLSYELAAQALTSLWEIYKEVSPDALNRPTHPSFERRLSQLKRELEPPEPIPYLFELVG